MNQLKFLLESELLTDEVKTQLTEAVTAMKEEFEGRISAEYATKLITEQEKLETNVVKMVEDLVTSEIAELKEDVARYRKLEVEYAQKLEGFKEEYQDKLSEAVETLIEDVITEELSELKEDLKESKKFEFGKRLFEAFADEFSENGFGGDLKDMATKLKQAQKDLTESRQAVDSMLNDKKKEELLSNLSGKKQKIMANLLEGVATDDLETKYNASIDFVLEDSKENSGDTITESDKNESGERVDTDKEHGSFLSEGEKNRLRHLINGKK